ncbi:MAG: hypothetical protein V2I54_01390 [Bacteroidales bacterium]|jgi:hypothetical protein|nr:hypothetical protein [Bacteroidales bacterium]
MHKSKLRKLFLSVAYTLIAIIVGIILYMTIGMRITHMFFEYKMEIYGHEIDSLFQEIDSKQFRVKHMYRSGDQGAIYFVKYDSLTNLAVIETTNYNDIFLKATEISKIDKIELSDGKTYTTIYNKPYPVIQQALNPRKSEYLKITFENPAQLDSVNLKSQSCLIKGNFSYVTFGNTQNCSIISFSKKLDNEIVVLKRADKLYFMIQSISNKSLIDIVNRNLLD